MDHSYWTTTVQRAWTSPDNEKPSANQWKARRRDRERERGRDRTSQSKLSWSLTITSHNFPLPPLYMFLFSKLRFPCFLLSAATAEASSQHSLFISLPFLYPCFVVSCVAQTDQSGVLHPLTLPPANQRRVYCKVTVMSGLRRGLS